MQLLSKVLQTLLKFYWSFLLFFTRSLSGLSQCAMVRLAWYFHPQNHHQYLTIFKVNSIELSYLIAQFLVVFWSLLIIVFFVFVSLIQSLILIIISVFLTLFIVIFLILAISPTLISLLVFAPLFIFSHFLI